MRHLGRAIGGRLLGATLFEADAGLRGIYHAHHGNEELVIVLDGTPTLRTREGDRELRAGDVAVFPRGEAGAHAISNRADRPARWLVLSTMHEPDLVEYPDAEAVGAFAGDAPTAGRDAPLELFFPRAAAISYAEIARRRS